MTKNDFLSLITLIAALGVAVGALALMYHLGDPTILGLFSPTSPSPVTTQAAVETITPTASATWTAAPSPTPTVIWQICTGVTDGHLHVRASAGYQSPILGILPEESIISPTGQRDGGWLAISAPLAGWVHSKFLCGGSP